MQLASESGQLGLQFPPPRSGVPQFRGQPSMVGWDVGVLTVGCIVGAIVGLRVGPGLGDAVGDAVGCWVGELVGRGVGLGVGLKVGDEVGFAVGSAVGSAVGLTVGFAVGSAVGLADGLADGSAVGFAVGSAVGCIVGFAVGLDVGGAVGVGVGDPVGDVVGVTVGSVVGIGVGSIVGARVGTELVGAADSVGGRDGESVKMWHLPTSFRSSSRKDSATSVALVASQSTVPSRRVARGAAETMEACIMSSVRWRALCGTSTASTHSESCAPAAAAFEMQVNGSHAARWTVKETS